MQGESECSAKERIRQQVSRGGRIDCKRLVMDDCKRRVMDRWTARPRAADGSWMDQDGGVAMFYGASSSMSRVQE
jgi:hypothetical protein